MSWPKKIYVATSNQGVYFTNDFLDPAIQPTWATINTGLGSIECLEFHLDPFHGEDRQYVLTEILSGDNKLYRRYMEGSWVEICSPADLETLFSHPGISCGIDTFCTDPSIDGRLWVHCTFGALDLAVVAYSDDYGDTWIPANPGYYFSGYAATIRAYGDNLYIQDSRLGYWYLHYSTDKGTNINYVWSSGNEYGYLNPLEPGRLYTVQMSDDLTYFLMSDHTVHSLITDVILGMDTLWFHPTDLLYQRSIYSNKLYVTTDGWVSTNSPSTITPNPTSISEWVGDNIDQMLLVLSVYGQNHVIGTLDGEGNTTSVGISGTNCGTIPYTDSIPKTAVVCRCGLQGITPGKGKVYTNAIAMPGYSDIGMARGEPMAGDRSAWDALNYPLRHTDDIDAGIHWTQAGIVGLLPGNLPDHDHSGDAGDGGQFDAQNLLSTGANDGDVLTSDGAGNSAWEPPAGGADPNAIHTNVAGEIAGLTEKDTPIAADMIIIEDSAAGNVKKMVEIGDLPVPALPDHDHSGDAGDGDTFDAANLTAGASTDGQVLTSDGAGNAAWEDVPPPAPPSLALDDLTDVNVPAPDDNDVLTWDDYAGEWVNAPPAASGGDVVGPAGATDDDIATFDTNTGKLIQDGGKKISDLIADPATPEQGDILYWTGAAWIRLAHGTATQYLKSGGHAANPGWDTPSGSGDVVGPAGATDGHLAVFNGATGKIIKDGGAPGGGGTSILEVQVFS